MKDRILPLRTIMGEFMKTELELSEEHGRPVAVKTSLVDPVAKVYGCLGGKFDTDAFMIGIRGVRG